MFDIHCHLIYGVDDGSDSLEESVKMLNIASSGGTKGIIATPHSNIPGSYENYWSKSLYTKLCEIRKAASDNNIPIEVFAGQEIFCTPDIIPLLSQNKLITLNNSRYILLEFPFTEYSDTVFSRIRRIFAEGYIPVIAHPERYFFVQEDEESLYRLSDYGCILQMNKGSMDGVFGENAEYIARFMLENELVDCIASDSHSPYSRIPFLEDVHEQISDEFDIDYADLLLETNPTNIICNKTVDRL